MSIKEFSKALESLTVEERDILLKMFMDNPDELMNNVDLAILYAKKVAELPPDFGMTIEN
jgi:DNA-directed RNA polymerase subunit F